MLIGLEASSLQGCKSGVGYYTENLLTGMMKAEPDNRYVLFSNRPFRTEDFGLSSVDELANYRQSSERGAATGDRMNWAEPKKLATGYCEVHDGHYFPVRAAWMQTALPAALRAVRPELCHFTNYLAP